MLIKRSPFPPRLVFGCAALICGLLAWSNLTMLQAMKDQERLQDLTFAMSRDLTTPHQQEAESLEKRYIELLASEPVHPQAWIWLSYLRLAAYNDRPGALNALRMSQTVTPYYRPLMVNRAYAFYNLRDLHNPEDKIMMKEEWHRAFLADSAGLIKKIRKNPLLIYEVDQAIQAGDPSVYKRWTEERKKEQL